MLFLNNLNLVALMVFGAASHFLVASQSPSFQCISDVEKPFAFCRRAKSLNEDRSAAVYGVARANAFRQDNYSPFSFNCQDLTIHGGPADNVACCAQNFGLKVIDQGAFRDMSPSAFDRHCTVMIT